MARETKRLSNLLLWSSALRKLRTYQPFADCRDSGQPNKSAQKVYLHFNLSGVHHFLPCMSHVLHRGNRKTPWGQISGTSAVGEGQHGSPCCETLLVRRSRCGRYASLRNLCWFCRQYTAATSGGGATDFPPRDHASQRNERRLCVCLVVLYGSPRSRRRCNFDILNHRRVQLFNTRNRHGHQNGCRICQYF